MFDKLKSKEAQIDKLQSKNVSYKVQILKAESQIKHKDEMGEDLKFIDFHQLQIENKKHVKDIDDRNKKLLKLKLDSGKIVQKLNALKKNLTEATKQQEELTRKLEDYNLSLAKKQQDVENTKKKIAASKEKNTIFRTMASMNKDKPKPLQFAQ
jgi:chromosome segregation ATPase